LAEAFVKEWVIPVEATVTAPSKRLLIFVFPFASVAIIVLGAATVVVTTAAGEDHDITPAVVAARVCPESVGRAVGRVYAPDTTPSAESDTEPEVAPLRVTDPATPPFVPETSPVVAVKPEPELICPDVVVPVRVGAEIVGPVANTTEPEPVAVVLAVPPFKIGRTPVIPVVGIGGISPATRALKLGAPPPDVGPTNAKF